MEPLRIPQTFQHQEDGVRAKLQFDPLQRSFQAEPEVDFLRCSTRRHVSGEFGHRLDGFDPHIDVTLECIKECAVIEDLSRDVRDPRPFVL